MTLVFRADATLAMGTGHIMRCLALAQAWQDSGGRALFAVSEAANSVRERLQSEGFGIVAVPVRAGSREDAHLLAELADRNDARWVVVDGYQFDAAYQVELKAAGKKIVFLDDYGHARQYAADVVLNQNAGAQESLYKDRRPYTRLLLGASYALLRREFETMPARSREMAPRGRKVLVTMGGSDPENFTTRAIRALSRVDISDLEVIVVSGGSNPHSECLELAAADFGKHITIRRNASNMAQLMAWADIAISGAGSTCWEICRSALPALVVALAENQRPLAEDLHRRGCLLYLGGFRDVSEEMMTNRLLFLLESSNVRCSLSLHGRDLVDGLGATRVVAILRGDDNVHLRRAERRDCRLLWEWANDPDVRAASFSPEPIPWAAHVAWFEDRLHRDRCFIFIAEGDEGSPVGQIRFDMASDGGADVAISIARSRRGRGLACILIRLGVEAIFGDSRCTRIDALVKTRNVASRKAFEKAGFTRISEANIQGDEAVRYVRSKN